MARFLRWAFRSLVRRGHLKVTTSGVLLCGRRRTDAVAVRFTSPRVERAILLNPELKLGEAYMDGTFVVDQGSIADFFELILGQDPMNKGPGWARPRARARQHWRRLQQHNPRKRARHNVAHHYDLDARLYSLFLDSDRQYSCAYLKRRPRRSMTLSSPKVTWRPSCTEPGNASSTSVAAGEGLRFTSRRSRARASPG